MGFWGIPIGIDSQDTNPVDTDVSTADTVARMVSLAHTYATDPLVLNTLTKCIHTAQTHAPSTRHLSDLDLVRGIWWWVHTHITFTEDEDIMARQLGVPSNQLDKELLISPPVLLSMPTPMGDCDDYSTLLATLLNAAHIKCYLVTVALDANQPFRFSHVYCAADVNGKHIYLDASHGSFPGWETSRPMYRKLEWSVN